MALRVLVGCTKSHQESTLSARENSELFCKDSHKGKVITSSDTCWLVLQWRWQLHPQPLGWQRLAASCWACLYKTASNAGRLCGHLHRRCPPNSCRRFDW